MSGKALLILVIGFTMIFIVMGYFWGSIATRSVDNHVSYYKNTIAHNLAVSGANLGLHEVLKDSSWDDGISKDYELGYINVSISPLDTTRVLISEGIFPYPETAFSVKDTVKVKLMLSTYAKFAWWIASVSANRTWVTGDTVWGGFHSNQTLNIDGDPVFYGRVSTSKGLKMKPGSNPKFLGGLITGLEVPFEGKKISLKAPKEAADEGEALGGTCNFNGVDLWLTFNSDGTVTYRSATNAGDDSTKYPPLGSAGTGILPISTMAPTGVIYLDKGDIYISGTLSGEITVVADQSSGSGGGNVYFTGDLVYSTPPMLPDGNGGYIPNNDCTDMMGLIATNDVRISSKNVANSLGGYNNNIVDKDLMLDAAVLSIQGGFQLQDMNPTYMNTPTGTIYLRGSMIAGKEETVANYNNNELLGGYNRHIVLDERFLVKPPLYFPYSDSYEILSWLE